MSRVSFSSRVLLLAVSIVVAVAMSSLAWADEPDEIVGSLEEWTYQEEGPLDNDELFKEYVNIQLGWQRPPATSQSAASSSMA